MQRRKLTGIWKPHGQHIICPLFEHAPERSTTDVWLLTLSRRFSFAHEGVFFAAALFDLNRKFWIKQLEMILDKRKHDDVEKGLRAAGKRASRVAMTQQFLPRSLSLFVMKMKIVFK
jgi:hypothetical protein